MKANVYFTREITPEKVVELGFGTREYELIEL